MMEIIKSIDITLSFMFNYSYFCKISLTSSGPEGEPSTLPSGVIIR